MLGNFYISRHSLLGLRDEKGNHNYNQGSNISIYVALDISAALLHDSPRSLLNAGLIFLLQRALDVFCAVCPTERCSIECPAEKKKKKKKSK